MNLEKREQAIFEKLQQMQHYAEHSIDGYKSGSALANSYDAQKAYFEIAYEYLTVLAEKYQQHKFDGDALMAELERQNYHTLNELLSIYGIGEERWRGCLRGDDGGVEAGLLVRGAHGGEEVRGGAIGVAGEEIQAVAGVGDVHAARLAGIAIAGIKGKEIGAEAIDGDGEQAI